jgi:hypothetical protein
MKQEDILKEAIDLAISNNIKIVRGPIFSFGKNRQIYACNALGALLIKNNKTDIIGQKGWWIELCKILDVKGIWWLFRFSVGFDNLNQIFIEKPTEGGASTYEELDSVSKLGIKLAKLYTLKDK